MWPFGKKSQILSGFYPHGRKSFQFSFTVSDDEEESEEHTSGVVSWRVYVQKKQTIGGKEKLQFELKCSPKKKISNADWAVVADSTMKLMNPDEPENNKVLVKTQTKFGKETFSSVIIPLNESLEEFKDENDKLCVQVEIGIKSMENLDDCNNFAKKRGEDAAFLVGDVRLYAILKDVRETSSVFISEWKDLPEEAEIRIENCTPEIFTIFLKMVYNDPFHVELEDVESLIEFGKKNEIELIREKCEKFLQKSVNDDAELIRMADKYGMQNVIVERMASIHSLPQLSKAFKHYRRFSDDTMRLLMKKFVNMA